MEMKSKLFNMENLQIGKTGKSIKLLYEKKPLKFLSCHLKAPFGVKKRENLYSNYDDYYIDCYIKKDKESYELFEKLDNKVKDLMSVYDNNYENYTYTSTFKGNGEYPKLIKLNVARKSDGNFNCVIFNEKKERILLTEENINKVLKKGVSFKCFIECSKIWVWKEKIGLHWNIVEQLRLILEEEKEFVEKEPKTEKYMLLD